MAEHVGLHIWSMRAVFLGLCLLLIFLHLLPLDTMPRNWAGPDFMLALCFAWVLRRPDYAPLVSIALVFLLTDFLYHRPPGLWTALVLIATQTLRGRVTDLRDLTFLVEWFSVATTLTAITIGYRVVLSVFLVDQAPLGLSLMQLVSTLLAYPLVVGVTQIVFRVRKAAPGAVETMSQG